VNSDASAVVSGGHAQCVLVDGSALYNTMFGGVGVIVVDRLAFAMGSIIVWSGF